MKTNIRHVLMISADTQTSDDELLEAVCRAGEIVGERYAHHKDTVENFPHTLTDRYLKTWSRRAESYWSWSNASGPIQIIRTTRTVVDACLERAMKEECDVDVVTVEVEEGERIPRRVGLLTGPDDPDLVAELIASCSFLAKPT